MDTGKNNDIRMDAVDTTQSEAHQSKMPELEVAPSNDATQRVKIDEPAVKAVTPTPRPAPSRPAQSRPAEPHPAQKKPAAEKPTKKRRKKSGGRRVALVLLSVLAALLLIAAIITVVVSCGSTGAPDNGLILNNVYFAGVNLGGMTPEQAKDALITVANNYRQLDMVVDILDDPVLLSPDMTQAELNIESAVKAAYDYGRTGSRAEQQKAQDQAATTMHAIPVLPHMILDTDYIREQVDILGAKYSTMLSDPSVRVEGTRPSMNMEEYDTSVVYQTLYIYVGTAEYGLDTEKLYNQILDAYASNIFEVVGECKVTPPDALDLEKVFADYCVAPKDADIDEDFNVTDEVYGYGFIMSEVKEKLENADYGTTLEIPLSFIKPDITAEDLAGNLFKDVLGSATVVTGEDTNLVINLKLVCKALNGLIIKSGEEFSFNDLIGETTRQKGYKLYPHVIGKTEKEIYGGGISTLASALYCSILKADLEILERHSHTYAPTFIKPGLDADVLYGSKDLRFTNDTPDPIRIVAEYQNGEIKVQLLGTDSKAYTVEIFYTTDKIYHPVTLVQVLPFDNAGGFLNGDVLQEPLSGCDVSVYKLCTDRPLTDDEGNVISPDHIEPVEVLVGQSHYAKRNKLVIEVLEPEIDPDGPGSSTETVDPMEPVDPDNQNPATTGSTDGSDKNN